jgi:hypothetical protein
MGSEMDWVMRAAGILLTVVALSRLGLAIVQPITRLVPVPRGRSPFDDRPGAGPELRAGTRRGGRRRAPGPDQPYQVP